MRLVFSFLSSFNKTLVRRFNLALAYNKGINVLSIFNAMSIGHTVLDNVIVYEMLTFNK